MNQLSPSCLEEITDAYEGSGVNDVVPSGHSRSQSDVTKFSQGIVVSSPLFPEVDALLSLFKTSGTQLLDLRKQVRSFNIVMNYWFWCT